MSLYYGRDHSDWEDLEDAGLAFLIERARLERVTSYTEMNHVLGQRTGLRLFDFVPLYTVGRMCSKSFQSKTIARFSRRCKACAASYARAGSTISCRAGECGVRRPSAREASRLRAPPSQQSRRRPTPWIR